MKYLKRRHGVENYSASRHTANILEIKGNSCPRKVNTLLSRVTYPPVL